MSTINGKPVCDGENGCQAPITHIDEKGFIYCAHHGAWRKSDYRRCRKLRPWEIRFIYGGKPIPSYQRRPKPKPALEAAAPEMLAKLKEIHEYEHGEDGACECALLSLIAKAEGRVL